MLLYAAQLEEEQRRVVSLNKALAEKERALAAREAELAKASEACMHACMRGEDARAHEEGTCFLPVNGSWTPSPFSSSSCAW